VICMSLGWASVAGEASFASHTYGGHPPGGLELKVRIRAMHTSQRRGKSDGTWVLSWELNETLRDVR